MNNVVRTRRAVRFTVTIALKKNWNGINDSTHLEEELFEEVGCIHNAENQDGGQVDREDRVHDPPAENNNHGETSGGVVFVNIVKSPVLDDVLGEDSVGLHAQPVGQDLHHLGLQLPHNHFHGADLQ